MTREEIKKSMRDTKKEVVIKNLHKLLSLVEGYPEYEDCISYAIAELEQEPFINKTCVSEKVCEHDKNVVINKIRAEIEQLKHQNTNISGYRWWNNAIDNCLHEIDAFKIEK